MDPIKLGNIIKNIRINNKLTQAEFAKSLGVTYQAVSKWETGKSIPDILMLKEISTKYNVSISSLLGTEDKKKNNRIFYIMICLCILLVFIFYLIKLNNDNDFEFKTITSNCDNFNISGSIAYSSDRTAIYISSINYCGGVDNNTYKSIECILYKESGNIETKLALEKVDNKNTSLEEFLKEIEFKVDAKGADCRLLANSKISLNIKALKEDGIVVNYDIPLKIDNTCK